MPKKYVSNCPCAQFTGNIECNPIPHIWIFAIIYAHDDQAKKLTLLQMSSGAVSDIIQRQFLSCKDLSYSALKKELLEHFGNVIDTHFALKHLQTLS